MWNNGKYIIWSHITKLYFKDIEYGFPHLPNLKRDHILLNAYSVMNVKLAAHILSETIGKTFIDFGPDEASLVFFSC